MEGAQAELGQDQVRTVDGGGEQGAPKESAGKEGWKRGSHGSLWFSANFDNAVIKQSKGLLDVE